jgi:hypothetical protein
MNQKGKAKKSGGTQIGVRLDEQTVGRLDTLKANLSLPGLDLGRADVARAAIIAGLEVLERKQLRRVR